MHRECRERFPHHRLQRIPLNSYPGVHHGTENVPGIPGMRNPQFCVSSKRLMEVLDFYIAFARTFRLLGVIINNPRALDVVYHHIWYSVQKATFYYTPRTTKLLGGYTGFTPSVRPSVRPSVPHAVSALYHLQLWMDSFHLRHKWSLPWEGVSRTMTFDLDLYLQGHLALT